MHIAIGIYEGKEINDAPKGGIFSPRALTIKEEIFTIIDTRVREATVLDVHDSNGIYGIEALSRGATVCRFVNPDENEAKLVSENLRVIGLDPKGMVVNDACEEFLKSPTVGEYLTEKYDVIFCQPKEPADFKNVKTLLAKQKPSGVTVVIYPHNKAFKFPEDIDGFQVVETREFDDKKVAVLLKINI